MPVASAKRSDADLGCSGWATRRCGGKSSRHVGHRGTRSPREADALSSSSAQSRWKACGTARSSCSSHRQGISTTSPPSASRQIGQHAASSGGAAARRRTIDSARQGTGGTQPSAASSSGGMAPSLSSSESLSRRRRGGAAARPRRSTPTRRLPSGRAAWRAPRRWPVDALARARRCGRPPRRPARAAGLVAAFGVVGPGVGQRLRGRVGRRGRAQRADRHHEAPPRERRPVGQREVVLERVPLAVPQIVEALGHVQDRAAPRRAADVRAQPEPQLDLARARPGPGLAPVRRRAPGPLLLGLDSCFQSLRPGRRRALGAHPGRRLARRGRRFFLVYGCFDAPLLLARPRLEALASFFLPGLEAPPLLDGVAVGRTLRGGHGGALLLGGRRTGRAPPGGGRGTGGHCSGRGTGGHCSARLPGRAPPGGRPVRRRTGAASRGCLRGRAAAPPSLFVCVRRAASKTREEREERGGGGRRTGRRAQDGSGNRLRAFVAVWVANSRDSTLE